MTKFLKILFCILGSMLVGFGLGMMMANFLSMTITGIKYWLMVSGILVLGGFFLGLGFIKKVPKKEEASKIKTMGDDKKKEEEKKMFQPKEEKEENLESEPK